jgi:hypothetical protein
MERNWKYMICWLWRLIVYTMVTIAIETKQFRHEHIALTQALKHLFMSPQLSKANRYNGTMKRT